MIKLLIKVFATILVAMAYTIVFLLMVVTTFNRKEIMKALSDSLVECKEFWEEPK